MYKAIVIILLLLILLSVCSGCVGILKESLKVGNIIKENIIEEKELTDEEKKKNNTIACIKVQPECEW